MFISKGIPKKLDTNVRIVVYNATPSEGIMDEMSPLGVLDSLLGILEPKGLCDRTLMPPLQSPYYINQKHDESVLSPQSHILNLSFRAT